MNSLLRVQFCLPALRRLLSSGTKPDSDPSVQHAVVSTFDLFSIGIGPSSSHTVGPMRAAKIHVQDNIEHSLLEKIARLRIDLYGSLAMTGEGHGTPNAIFLGLEGESPESVDTNSIQPRIAQMYKDEILKLNGTHPISFSPKKHLIFHYGTYLPAHPNGMRISCFDKNGDLVSTNEYYSIGGGFVVNEALRMENVYFLDTRVDFTDEATCKDNAVRSQSESRKQEITAALPTNAVAASSEEPTSKDSAVRPQSKSTKQGITAALPFHNAESLLNICTKKNLSIAEVVFENELQWRTKEQVTQRTLQLWNVMNNSILNGISARDGEYLPGGLKVKRRAPGLHQRLVQGLKEYAGFSQYPSTDQLVNLTTSPEKSSNNRSLINPRRIIRPKNRHLPALDYLSLYAIAVNEENAAGGRVVTAPTNGAAGTIPSVLKYYLEFICPNEMQRQSDIIEFLLTASAIGMLFKRGASISAAEMGCQGEVGVACSMAAAAFTAVMGGTPQQITNAAEIGIEHNLGLTCDPPMGLVVIPCIERNALAAVKAVTAAQLALNGDGFHRVSLDQAIATMRQTGIDMQSKYKETSEGGLAVNVPSC